MSKKKVQANIEIGRGVAMEKMLETATFLTNRIHILDDLCKHCGEEWNNVAVDVEKGIAIEKLKMTYKELQKQYDHLFPNTKQDKEPVPPKKYSEQLAPYAFRLQIHKTEGGDKLFADVDFFNDDWIEVRHTILEAITYLGEGDTMTNTIVVSDLLMDLPSLATAIWLLEKYKVPFALYNMYEA